MFLPFHFAPSLGARFVGVLVCVCCCTNISARVFFNDYFLHFFNKTICGQYLGNGVSLVVSFYRMRTCEK